MSSLPESLARLPFKARVPIERLIRAKLVKPEAVELAVDGAEVAGQPERALPFLTAVLHLMSERIPVRDVIDMCRANGRRIRLDWSPARWASEHERLSRLETFKRLSSENVRYDVAAYRAAVPVGMPGYVIASSRRLAMEGLWQRHCVASYHERILQGRSAIVVVFMDGRRWTVEVELTGRSDTPLRMLQAASRLNVRPDGGQRRRLLELLGAADQRSDEPTQCPSRDAPVWPEQLRRTLPVLREHGISRVECYFEGSGDSGALDEAVFVPHAPPREAMVEIPVIESAWVGGRWHGLRSIQRRNLVDAIREIATEYLNCTGVNWYDNDGGFGDFVVDVGAGTVSLEVNVRFTHSECQFARTVDIESGEEVD